MIDCHTHWHPEWSGADSRDPSLWLEVLDRHGITHAAVLPTRGMMDDTLLIQDNNDIASAADRSDGRMLPFCTVNLTQGKKAIDELERCLDVLKVRGIKFHPWMQGVSINHPLMNEVCARAASADVPILFHDGTPPMSLPSQVGLLARRHPKTTLVLGHCGLLEFWQEALMVLNGCPNVWGCLCSPHPGALRQIFQNGPQDRLCFGSDFGFGKADLLAYRLGLLRTALPDAGVQDRILNHNPRRLFRIDTETPAPAQK